MDIEKRPVCILAGIPETNVHLNKFFDSGDNSITKFIMSNPSSIRYAGWNLSTMNMPKMVKGDYLEVKSGSDIEMRLYSDGTLIAKGSADGEFLSWPLDKKKFAETPKINTLAIIEWCYSFMLFYKKLIPYCKNMPKSILFKVWLKNFVVGEKNIFLVPAKVNNIWYKFGNEKIEAPQKDMEKEIEINTLDLQSKMPYQAHKLTSLIFTWFGVRANEIPYTAEDENGKRFIDEQQIINSQ